VYSYSTSAYLIFFAPRRGATAGPFFLTEGAPPGPPIEDPLLEYVDEGLADCPVFCGKIAGAADGAGPSSTYEVGTSPSLYPARTLIHPDPAMQRLRVSDLYSFSHLSGYIMHRNSLSGSRTTRSRPSATVSSPSPLASNA